MPFYMKGSPLRIDGTEPKTTLDRVAPHYASMADLGEKLNNYKKPTPPSKSNAPSKGNAFQEAASKLGLKNPNDSKKVAAKSAGATDANYVKESKNIKTGIRTASTSEIASGIKKKTSKPTVAASAPKSRTEKRLQKTKDKTASLKSEFNAKSDSGRKKLAVGTKAKKERLARRTKRLEKRVAKQNK